MEWDSEETPSPPPDKRWRVRPESPTLYRAPAVWDICSRVRTGPTQPRDEPGKGYPMSWDELVCPFDHGPLTGTSNWLTCALCGRGYPLIDGIPALLAADEDPRWRRAQQRLAQRLADPRVNLFANYTEYRRRDGRLLEEHLATHVTLGPRSRVLQVGPGGEAEIQYFRTGVRYAVEPLAGWLADCGRLRWGQVRWVAARGEELPFADGTFDAIVLRDVLDAVESPARVLEQCTRCLAPRGVLWISSEAHARWSWLWRQMSDLATARRRMVMHRWSLGQLLRGCRRAGLELVACQRKRVRGRRWTPWGSFEVPLPAQQRVTLTLRAAPLPATASIQPVSRQAAPTA